MLKMTSMALVCRGAAYGDPRQQLLELIRCGSAQTTALRLIGLFVCILGINTNSFGDSELQPIPDASYEFLENYCLDCHDDFERKGEISFEDPEIDWSNQESLELWERAIGALRSGEMPPKKERKPSPNARASMVDWLDRSLSEHAPIGGSTLRRLNRREYVNSLNELLDTKYELPDGFPVDGEANGFDNQASALMLSGPLLQSYARVANDLAEKLFPPARKPLEPITSEVLGKDFTYAYSSGLVVGERMRVVSSSDALSASATWPSRFEASATGRYQVELMLSAFNPPPGESVVCRVYAVNAVEAPGEKVDTVRQLGEVSIQSGPVQQYRFEGILEKGETIALRYDNASLAEDQEKLAAHVKRLFQEDPLLAAAYKQADGKVERGRLGWYRLKALMKSDLLPDPPSEESLDELVSVVIKNLRVTTEVLEYKHFEEGPALEVSKATVFGPIELVDGKEEAYWKERASKLLGRTKGKSDEEIGREFVRSFLPVAFRRPVNDEVFQEYWELMENEISKSGRLEDGLHMALRTALKSPYFLYRGFEEGSLDGYGLAARLSYFLTSGPPDSGLMVAAADGSILKESVLRQHAIRLIDSKASKMFIRSFLDQWLDLAALENLTPDSTLFDKPRVFKYTDDERSAFVEEPNMFFREMLDTNRPMEDFVDPDFTYTNVSVGKNVYEFPMKSSSKKDKKLQRVSFERGGRFGGVLGMAGVMTATANGVDTQPVVRGVWVLENILGNPPPPPPDAVPALTPDTSKSETPKEMLAAHMQEESCAACHKKIDPVGFVLESFDPIGRWRTEYPKRSGNSKDKKSKLLAVETDGVMPDGTKLNDIRDLKAYLVRDITPFSECLSEKLLTYATGRHMSYGDRKLITEIVEDTSEANGGFRDLMLALIESESFRMK